LIALHESAIGLKRKFVNQRYAAEIDAMYRDRPLA
jgi:hypothetical protein